MSASESEVEVNGHQNATDDHLSEEDAGGLFGSGSEDGGSGDENRSSKRRKLDDSELDSGDDEGRRDRLKELVDEEDDAPERTAIITDISIGRHHGPSPSDGELYMLQFPSNIGINPKSFTLDGFEPPVTDHHSSGPASSTFSAFATSNNTIRWRKSPSDSSVIQSNARVNRWSDGSLTLQLASNPREQFELSAKALAQPQVNPKKPTPTSVKGNRSNLQAYDSRLDSHTYLAAPHEHAGLMRNIRQITVSLAVQSSEQDDDALLRLQQGLAAAARGNKATADGGVEVISINEDPENAKRRAELAEKEKTKMQRRYQTQQERENNRANNVLKRSGLRPGGMGAGGLTVGGLEDDEMMGSSARKTKSKARKPRRRNDEYSDDEDFGGRRRTKEDEYDEDDGFLVGSDEEPEVVDESEEEAEGSDLDAEGEEDEEVMPRKSEPKPPETGEEAAGGARGKRRRIIEDEDEE
ncbi:uncharacterized protein KY384_002176 [Bacidia gigantensis]|uniref:uncharacterized protein n=1 Tax=Bacidia gigantensis TaxID=2732470 RepID=UPI001D0575E3|nr:uncharacterized protein KY384_002176 [Bacidia gigantensis]KAG8533393.1 hypothetical protein KY384_002176 [Bacidia gigantensis]